MTNFHVLWDKKSELALVVCELSEVGLEDGLVLVSRQMPDGNLGACGVFPVESEPSGLSTVFAISVPQFDELSVFLHFELFGEDGSGGVHKSEDIELFEPADGAPALSQGKKWCVEKGEGEASLHVFDGQDAAPDDTISQVYFSPRDGNTVAPCISSELDGEGGVLELSAQMIDVNDPDGETGFRVAELHIKTIDNEVALETFIKCFSLSASLHVLSLLEDDKTRMHRDDNFCEARLRLNSNLQGCLRIMLGKDHKEVWPDHVSANYDTMRSLGFLDRIVIETSPPATFVHRDREGNPRAIGRNGVAILSLGANGKWVADDGKLVDRIGREESSFSGFEDTSFVSKMATYGYSINRADTKGTTDISAFVYAWTLRRMGERLKGLGRQLRPANFSVFCQSAEVYSALSGIDAEAISRRDGLGLGANLTSHSSDDAARQLGKKMLASGKSNEKYVSREIVARWANDSELQGWVVFAAAINETVRHASEAGLTLDVNGLSTLLSREDPTIGYDVKTMSGDIKMLIDAGIFSVKGENALQDLGDIDTRRDSLQVLKKIALNTIGLVMSTFGPFELLPDRPQALLADLANFQEDDNDMPRAPNRIANFFAEAMQKELDGILPDEEKKTFARQAGMMLCASIKDAARKIELLVAAGLKDPIELDHDNANVVSLGFGEKNTQSRFMKQLDEPLEQWLQDTSPQPAIIEKWRRSLRESHEQLTGFQHQTKS